jgi:hypothetical protein
MGFNSGLKGLKYIVCVKKQCSNKIRRALPAYLNLKINVEVHLVTCHEGWRGK